MSMNQKLDVIVIGAGAAGLACGIEARKRNLDFLIIDRGAVVNAIAKFPTDMKFFTTPDLLEIGGLPLVCATEKPRRSEVLKYYRRVVEYYRLPLNDYEEVLGISGSDEDFTIATRDRLSNPRQYRCRKLIVAVGYYDNPNMLSIPGEELGTVSHYYKESHPYFGHKVAVIGGKNSAVETALNLYRNGVEVTLIHRGPALGKHIKYWVLPDIQNRIQNGEIKALLSSEVTEIRPSEIVIQTPSGELILENDFVLAMTGYHPDEKFVGSLGIEMDPELFVPSHDPETLESNVQGIYLAGAVVSGRMTNRIFIENGRFHGEQIFKYWPETQTTS